ncbi:methyl-accepting chemotaxis protein [Rhizobium sp. PP-F2F-G48]|uniref:globin-coupled sensor protein n=1 Tax=Rhizobium sp. PP-F2F-G48 TaxID=2135651 RepID=UPI0010449471|nr:globin-coupled sensor protein [Rhizobium sp. PP-F2F-G48]TCM58371.1 methyl-accepting chemotaxis protein [Rhizobium sp. PP-F2F-G48]
MTKAKPETAILNERLDFVGLLEPQRRNLAALAPTINASLAGALEIFYAKVRHHPDTAKFFSGDSHVAQAKKRQAHHWETISSAKYDQAYIDEVTLIGRTHARLGLEPRWYIGGYALMIENIVRAVIDKELDGFLVRKKRAKLGDDVTTVVKAALVDMDYAISVYLDVLAGERAKAEERQAVLKAEQDEALAALGEALAALSNGDLTRPVHQALASSFDTIKTDFNGSIETLGSAMSEILQAVGFVLAQSSEIAAATDDMAKRTERQAAALEETAAALEEISSIARQSETRTAEVQSVVTVSASEAAASGKIVEEAVQAMSDIVQSSSQMNDIIAVIDEIAFQTNLLALNAGVEAARAGEQGKGFAVVAQEVRELAQRSARAAKEIKELIARSSQDVARGVALVNTTGKALKSIGGQVEAIDEHMTSIAQSSREQATGIAEINIAIGSLDSITQQNAAMVEETSASTVKLSSEAERLSDLVAAFRTPSGNATRAPETRSAPARQTPRPSPQPATGYATEKKIANGGWSEY